jgi:hypothetical protein
VHDAEHEHHGADLHAGLLQRADLIHGARAVADVESDEAEIDEVKAHHEQMVHRVR